MEPPPGTVAAAKQAYHRYHDVLADAEPMARSLLAVLPAVIQHVVLRAVLRRVVFGAWPDDIRLVWAPAEPPSCVAASTASGAWEVGSVTRYRPAGG